MKIKYKDILYVRDKFSHNDVALSDSIQHHKYVGKWVNSFSKPTDKLLEIGCGNCVLRNFLHSEYFGLDPIKHQDLTNESYYFHGTGEAIPFNNCSFDFVLIKDSINYFSEIAPLYLEVSRVLKDDGILLITEKVGEHFNPITQIFKNFIKKYTRLGRKLWDSTYLNWYSIYYLIRTAKIHGFLSEFSYSKRESRYYLIAKKTPVISSKKDMHILAEQKGAGLETFKGTAKDGSNSGSSKLD